jgi:hypothetical protein
VKAIVASLAIAPLVLAAACSTTPSSYNVSGSQYWRTSSASRDQFRSDNVACGERAARLGGVTGPHPENAVDKPMQKWPNTASQDAYIACMGVRGWDPA